MHRCIESLCVLMSMYLKGEEKKQKASALFPVTASFSTLALSQASVEARKQGSKLLRMP